MKTFLSFILSTIISCIHANDFKTGAEQLDKYLPLLEGKNIAIVANQTSVIENTHLVDTLLAKGVHITTIFSPEHGFRGNHDAGKKVTDGKDVTTGLSITSLYGKNKKPSAKQLHDIDVVLFDIQDVGVRFYTYLSTLHYVMEACAEQHKQVIVLDRPNPNAHYIDGPVLDTAFRSFVGIHPIPVIYGCTLGEMAQMINGEKWLKKGVSCSLKVIALKDYTHQNCSILPVKPSPNLPNALSIAIYPSLCFFEPTVISIGRGTDFPFQVMGAPAFTDSSFTFTPRSIEGASKYPKHENEACFGTDLRNRTIDTHFTLSYLLNYYKAYPKKETFFTNEKFFNLLAGNNQLIEHVKQQISEQEIKKTWQKDLKTYKKIRKKYVLYRD
ncbi:MAG: exo-beta-N-acetylmuramidase NamZ domain-containing protein [Cyclobacteriaceae bacterium]